MVHHLNKQGDLFLKPEPPSETRVCIRCNEEKPETEYHHYEGRKLDGTRRFCKPCLSAYMIKVAELKKAHKYPHHNPVCELCERHEEEVGTLHLDHCHVTGRYRGYLCRGCNTSLGQLGDDIAGLQNAIAYIKKREV